MASDGVLWGIEDETLLQFDGTDWTAVSDPPFDSTSFHTIIAHADEVWVSNDIGLAKYDIETAVWDTYLFEEWSPVAPVLNIDRLEINDIAFDKDGTLWLASNQGVLHLRLPN